jgi:hypothetical protein
MRPKAQLELHEHAARTQPAEPKHNNSHPVRCPLVESSRVKLALYDDRQPAEIDEYRLIGAEIENVSDKRRLTTFATDHYIDTGATSRDAGYVSSC